MKKICFVVAIPDSAHAFLKDHIRELVKHYEVHLVANFPNEDRSKDFREIGVTCHQVAIERPISLSHDLKALFSLRALFRKERFDTVHSVTPKPGCSPPSPDGWQASKCASTSSQDRCGRHARD